MIRKIRKKPVEVEAIQLQENSIRQVYEFIHGKTDSQSFTADETQWADYENSVRREGLRLKTLESANETQIASIGDWIIKGVQGEFYPIKDEILKQTYEFIDK